MSPLHGTPEALLSAIVARCRARAGLVLFVRSSAVACAVTLTVAVATRLVWYGNSNVVMWMASAIAIGVGAGSVVTVRRYPSRREVAARIDRHLSLEDSVVAALQMQVSSAPVGPLIVRQALGRAGSVSAAAVFPMEVRRAAAMLAAALLLVVATLPGSTDEPIASGGGRSISTSDAGAGEAAGARAKGSSSTTAQPGTRKPVVSAFRRTLATPENGAASAEPRPSEAPGPQKPPATGQQGARGRGGARDAGSGREAPGLARASAGTDAGGGAGSAGSGPARGAGSGGVRGGALIASATGATRTTPDQQPSTRYQQAQRNAEAALTRGDIPPELRSYVREYFRAITK